MLLSRSKKKLFVSISMALALGFAPPLTQAHEGESPEPWSEAEGCGTMKTFLKANPKTGPTEVGVQFPARLFECLPDTAREWSLDFPKRAEHLAEPWNHTYIIWRPQGHIPETIYDVPHLDFHFFMVSAEERECYCSDQCGSDDSAQCNLLPGDSEIPMDYINGPSSPMEGVHWIDLTSGEFNNLPFDQTFILGSYDGDMIFYEPMITIEYFEALATEGAASRGKPTLSEEIFSIKQPEEVGISGWYPRAYRIAFDQGKKEYVVSLIDFYFRTAND